MPAEPSPDGDTSCAAQHPPAQLGLSPPSSSPPQPGDGQTRPRRKAKSVPRLGHRALRSHRLCPSQRVSAHTGWSAPTQGVIAHGGEEQSTTPGPRSTRGCVAGDSSDPGSGRQQGAACLPAVPARETLPSCSPPPCVMGGKKETPTPHPSTHTLSCQLLGHLKPKGTFPRGNKEVSVCYRGKQDLPSGKSKSYKMQRCLVAPTWVGGDGWCVPGLVGDQLG